MTGAKEESREFLIAVRIKAGAREFIKKTAEDAGLRSLPGLFLVSVERPRKAATNLQHTPKESSSPRAQTTPATVAPPAEVASVALVVSGEEEKGKVDSEGVDVVDPAVDPLQADDVLWYAGTAASIAMIRKIPGLAPYATDQVDKLNANSQERRLIQAVVAKTGPLVGKSIRDIKFRIEVQRGGPRGPQRASGCTQDRRRRAPPGDGCCSTRVPTFTGGGSQRKRFRARVRPRGLRAPAVTTSRPGPGHRRRHDRLTPPASPELIIAAIFAAGIMIACGALSEQEARDAIKWDVIVTIAAAFGMSKARRTRRRRRRRRKAGPTCGAVRDGPRRFAGGGVPGDFRDQHRGDKQRSRR